MAIESDFSYEIEGFEFGRETDYYVSSVEFGDSEISSSDAPLPRTDGESFGRDFRSGRVITFEGNILTNRSAPGSITAAPAAQNLMAEAWDREDIRLNPGVVVALRMNRNGRKRRVYGRPRQLRFGTGATSRGRIPFLATFKTVDHLYYDDEIESTTVQMIPTEAGGLSGTLSGDWVSSAGGYSTANIVVGGVGAWLTFKIYGPTTAGFLYDPDIEIVGQWRIKLLTSIAYDDSVEISPYPWARFVRKALNGANLTGAFTATSQRLSALRVPPGTHQIILRGNDPTGTSRVDVSWRKIYRSF